MTNTKTPAPRNSLEVLKVAYVIHFLERGPDGGILMEHETNQALVAYPNDLHNFEEVVEGRRAQLEVELHPPAPESS